MLLLLSLALQVSCEPIHVFNMTTFRLRTKLQKKVNLTCVDAASLALRERIFAYEGPVERERINWPICDMPKGHSTSFCFLPHEDNCNDFSSCLSDECDCENSFVFNCGDNSGCISIDQVCDGLRDCSDGSDECVCHDYVNCVEEFGEGICLNADKRVCPKLNEIKNEDFPEILQENWCFPFTHIELGSGGVLNLVSLLALRSLEQCHSVCPNYTQHCNRVNWAARKCATEDIFSVETRSIHYDCNINSANKSQGENILKRLTQVCDGKPDCWNKADEQDCFNRFLCRDNNRSLHISRICDLVQDCNDGSDECQNCTVSLMYSEHHLIGFPFLRVWIFFQTLLILLCNIWAFTEHFEAKKVSKTGKIDRLLCLQLCVYDAMMSCYLGVISVKNLQFYGNYCRHDSNWRTSFVCDFCGSIFSFSSHGSMLTAALMGLSRAYNIVYTFTDMSYSRWVGVCISLNVANFLNSILPSLPVVYIEDFFTVEMFFDKNPITPKANKEQLETVYMLYKNVSNSTSSVREMLKELNNMTTRNIYDVTRRLGFYGKSPLCVQNLFSTEPKLVAMKGLYVFVVLVIITMVMVSYAVILYVTKKRAIENNGVEDAAAAERRAFLSFKVSLVIATQMICWLPIILATCTTLLGQDIPPEIYEVAAIISLPLNSLFNPICHSTILKKIYQYVKTNLFTQPNVQVENAN